MADYDWFDDRCDCDIYSGNGHKMTCKDGFEAEVERRTELYKRGYDGYERKLYCRHDGLYVANVDIHDRWHADQLRIAEDASWGGLNRPIGGNSLRHSRKVPPRLILKAARLSYAASLKSGVPLSEEVKEYLRKHDRFNI